MTDKTYIDGIPLKDYGKPSSKSFYPEFQQIENGCKVSVPLFNELELKELDYNIQTYYDEIIEQIYKTVSRDREIIVLKKVIQKQDTEINKLNNVIDKIKDITRWLIIIPSRDKEGDYRPIKNTTAQECYKALAEIKEILEERRGEYE